MMILFEASYHHKDGSVWRNNMLPNRVSDVSKEELTKMEEYVENTVSFLRTLCHDNEFTYRKVSFGLMNKAIFVWTVCSTFLFLLVLKLNKIFYWNWFIIFMPMWLVDVILFTASILYMSRKFTHILGEHDVGSRFTQTLSLGFILCKLISQVVLCLSLEGHLDVLLNIFYQSFFVDQASYINKTDNSTIIKYRMVYAVFPLWTTLVLCLLIVCAQILTPRLTEIWSFSSNKEPSNGHNERRKQQKIDILSEGVELN
ncbi:hypothetical protein MN116_002453 [Schistosoma mekongi]|uniref:Transmembrane protein n=1 Tax=Schistosoma mekongi TaxID=38744 RepID=A0AAE1ZKK7_SCHME|nr:hypothetical protein MN116_002453 [Schistosoma mekongi]